MLKENFEKEYDNKGFIIRNKLLTVNETQALRKLILDVFRKKGDPANLVINNFNNKILENRIIEILTSKDILNDMAKLSKMHNTEVCLLPHFEIMLNNHTMRSVTLGVGWHRDCGGEMKFAECRNYLKSKEYVFGKVGIYLQNNEDYGGSIDIVPSTHKDIAVFGLSLKKILNFIFLNVASKFPVKKNILFTKILEPFTFYLLKAIKLKPYPGQYVLFDSRILHRGSPIDESKTKFIKQMKDKGNDVFSVPTNFNKIAIYCQYGSKLGVQSYLRDRNSRSGENEETIWKKQINVIKKSNNKLALSMLSFIE